METPSFTFRLERVRTIRERAGGKSLESGGNGVEQGERIQERGDLVAGQDEHGPGRLLQVWTPFADRSHVETPSFTFRLERVRTIRERAEDRAREALTVELRSRAEGEHLLRDATDAVIAARDAGRTTVTGGRISATDFISAQAFLERTERLRVEASLELARREAEVDARR